MEEILEINGITYIKKERIADIEKERDKAVADLNKMKEILGKSFKDLAVFITEEQIKEEPKLFYFLLITTFTFFVFAS